MPFRVVKIVQFLPSILTRALARICNLGVIDSCNNAHLYLSSVSGLYVQKKWISDCVKKGRVHIALFSSRDAIYLTLLPSYGLQKAVTPSCSASTLEYPKVEADASMPVNSSAIAEMVWP